MTSQRPRRRHSDSGASLIMAIGFVLMIGTMSGGLVGLATSGLNNRTTLVQVRNRQYAADGAVQQAIFDAGGRDCSSSESAVNTPNGPTLSTLNSIAIRVDWVNACGVIQSGDRGSTATASSSDGTIVAQRNVIFSACVDTGAACLVANVIIRAEVNFQQALGGGVSRTYVLSWSTNQ